MGFQFEALQETDLHAEVTQDNSMEEAGEANELHELHNPVGFAKTNYNY